LLTMDGHAFGMVEVFRKLTEGLRRREAR